ncbi:MAG: E3 ubiquitin-protein ligase rnf4 [Marteilia pararefringens]
MEQDANDSYLSLEVELVDDGDDLASDVKSIDMNLDDDIEFICSHKITDNSAISNKNISPSISKKFTKGIITIEDDGHSACVNKSMNTSFDSPGKVSQNVIKCPVCLETAFEILKTKRTLMAAKCGHIFCSSCAELLLTQNKKSFRCPVCRKIMKNTNFFNLYF